MGDLSLTTFDPTSIQPGIVATATTPPPSTNLTDYLNVNLTPDQEQLVKDIVNQNLSTTIYTHYIVIGDEPSDSILTVDLSSYMTAESFQNLSDNLRYMPRANLKDFMETNIRPVVDPGYYEIIRKAIINLFNKVNVDEINKRAIGPWTWEAKKTEALYLSQQPADIQTETLSQYLSPVPPSADDLRVADLTAQFAALPSIGDEALNIRRMAAIKGLLNLKEYDAAQQIIDQYKNMDASQVKVLVDPSKMASLPVNPAPTTDLPQASPQNSVVSNVAQVQTGSSGVFQNPIARFF